MRYPLLILGGAALLALASCKQAAGPAGGAAGPVGPAPSTLQMTTKSGVQMVGLPGGSFTMGNDQGNADEAPAHKVTVSPFAMDIYPVTHEMFVKAQMPDPSHFQDAKGPVEKIRWRDAKQYCNERSRLEGLRPCYDEKTTDYKCDYTASGYRLPTEAEWEYAARCGADGPVEATGKDALRQYAWYADNADQKTHPVGQKKPNAFGLYDMYGNVSTWCEDVYDPAYYKSSPATDPRGPESPGKDVKRVLRGGNWKATADMCSVSRRQGERTGDTDACFATDYVGVRCVRALTPEEQAKLRNSKVPAR